MIVRINQGRSMALSLSIFNIIHHYRKWSAGNATFRNRLSSLNFFATIARIAGA
jgi:hypothetical protein